MSNYGPGFYRMMNRLGKDAAEALRLDTIERQKKALAEVPPIGEVQDRRTYTEYPKPKARKKAP